MSGWEECRTLQNIWKGSVGGGGGVFVGGGGISWTLEFLVLSYYH